VTEWSQLVRPSLIGVDPYRPGPSVDELKARYGLKNLVKLNWNEGLLGPFPDVGNAVVGELDRAWMYPEHAYSDFREAVASWLGTRPELIVPGHGIQALIATVAHAFLDPGDAVVVPSPTYGLYAQVSTAAGARVERVPGRGHRHPGGSGRASRSAADLALRPEQPDRLAGDARRMGGASHGAAGALCRRRGRGLHRIRPP
jgi:histidinol-phosphate/aromatic aminotransferase/cobyric acid decarboxylase-like protein